jgi:hypothetical protein
VSKTLRWIYLLLSLTQLSLAQEAPEILTNDSVLQMVKGGLPESVVADMVRTHQGKYALTSSQLIELKRSGVPPSVLSAMIAKDAETHASFQAARTRPDSASAPGEWVVRSAPNKLTAAPTIEAATLIPVTGDAKVRTVATCGIDRTAERMNAMPSQLGQVVQGLMNSVDDHAPQVATTSRTLNLDTRMLAFRFQYLPMPGSGLALSLTTAPQTVTENPFGGGATISAPRSCVFMRVVVEGRGREGVQSDFCGIPNVAAVSFASMRAADITGAMTNFGQGGTGPLDKFAAGLLNTFATATDPTIATMKEAMNAHEISVELTLTDGDSALVRIEPAHANRHWTGKVRLHRPAAKCSLLSRSPANPSSIR